MEEAAVEEAAVDYAGPALLVIWLCVLLQVVKERVECRDSNTRYSIESQGLSL
jgi:hypothetical protein